jgi:hypothetical protein
MGIEEGILPPSRANKATGAFPHIRLIVSADLALSGVNAGDYYAHNAMSEHHHHEDHLPRLW